MHGDEVLEDFLTDELTLAIAVGGIAQLRSASAPRRSCISVVVVTAHFGQPEVFAEQIGHGTALKLRIPTMSPADSEMMSPGVPR